MLPYDVFAFTMIQESMAVELDVELGKYYHNTGSFHIYEEHYELAKQMVDLKEPTPKVKAPELHSEQPFPVWDQLPEWELAVRKHAEKRTKHHHGGARDDFFSILPAKFVDAPPYWQQMGTALGAFGAAQSGATNTMNAMVNNMGAPFAVYGQFLVDAVKGRTA